MPCKYLKTFLLAGAILVAHFQWAEAAQTDFLDVPFATVDGHTLKLDLFMPEKVESPYLVIWIHGGGWAGGDKKWCNVKWLRGQGYAVASISYRLSGQAVFPAQIHDVKAAVRWLRAHAEEYGYRTDRIAVSGASAGGHLATLLGLTPDVEALEGKVGDHLDQSSRVDVVLDFYGAMDFIQRAKNQPWATLRKGGVVFNLLGGPVDELEDMARLASPVFHVTPDDPPLLLVYGVGDETVRIGQGQRIFNRYLEEGLPVEFHALDIHVHGGDVYFQKVTRAIVESFLEKHLLGIDPTLAAEEAGNLQQ